ncbi:MAG: protein kinase [Clostridia bacterium]|nr:protein kinase [Clostridia bacterium]
MAVDNFSTLFNGYKLGRQIGSGTDGRVYLLKPKENEKKSVVKIIKLSHKKILDTKDKNDEALFAYSDEEYCAAFIKNITDNIELVRSYDSGKFFADYYEWENRPSSDSDADILLIRMEALTPLSDFLGEYSFTQEEVLRLAACLCGSLDKCRDFGFIYPNLKPENVMFDSIGRCKLGDLGTFCCIPPVKNSIAYRHTQQYMAPEFYNTEVINDTCDTYSLGLVMYALLNKGRLPFLPTYPAEITMNELSHSLKKRVDGEEIPAPKMADTAVSAVVLKAISHDPKNRYRTPRHMLSDIRKLLNGEEVNFDEDNVEEYTCAAEAQVSAEENFNEETQKDREYNENTVYGFYEKEYGSVKADNNKECNHSKAENETKNYDVKNTTGIKLNKHQKTVLTLLIIALFVLVITVVILAIKYLNGSADGNTAMVMLPFIQPALSNFL